MSLNDKSFNFEWCLAFIVTSYVALRCLVVYDIPANNIHETKYLLLSCVLFIVSLAALAKSKLFNIFKHIRNIPKHIKYIYWIFKNDYINWKNNTGFYERYKK